LVPPGRMGLGDYYVEGPADEYPPPPIIQVLTSKTSLGGQSCSVLSITWHGRVISCHRFTSRSADIGVQGAARSRSWLHKPSLWKGNRYHWHPPLLMQTCVPRCQHALFSVCRGRRLETDTYSWLLTRLHYDVSRGSVSYVIPTFFAPMVHTSHSRNFYLIDNTRWPHDGANQSINFVFQRTSDTVIV